MLRMAMKKAASPKLACCLVSASCIVLMTALIYYLWLHNAVSRGLQDVINSTHLKYQMTYSSRLTDGWDISAREHLLTIQSTGLDIEQLKVRYIKSLEENNYSALKADESEIEHNMLKYERYTANPPRFDRPMHMIWIWFYDPPLSMSDSIEYKLYIYETLE